jgi:hypothetical protein
MANAMNVGGQGRNYFPLESGGQSVRTSIGLPPLCTVGAAELAPPASGKIALFSTAMEFDVFSTPLPEFAAATSCNLFRFLRLVQRAALQTPRLQSRVLKKSRPECDKSLSYPIGQKGDYSSPQEERLIKSMVPLKISDMVERLSRSGLRLHVHGNFHSEFIVGIAPVAAESGIACWGS